MRPLKISREELLLRCARTFKRYGYNGTTMDMLSAACGLTKASFYHHYPNKEALLRDVLESMHDGMKNTLFAAAYNSNSSPIERISVLGRRAKKLFQDDTIGCLMGVVAMDASYSNASFMEPIRAFMDEWAQAYAHILTGPFEADRAESVGKQLVADYEGAILLARIYQDPSLIDGVTARAVELLSNAI
ncbi:TetR/AcrR family transcriptional regulator [Pseudomonas kurunegalensis]|uniref:TetR/AcrR family transcriptional regulator n=1 Tax=Pseudomonas kurunegalensis TaxID=485880 RepID=UPI00256FE265|nr:TetR/AcrR family transcriptional regulator [Pseudomonas kurunegalensis]WJD65091.1 TetR/AcrR family transcriptional regulator [Pseudomonas kurunegalensis]